jgi:hypothetical protein
MSNLEGNAGSSQKFRRPVTLYPSVADQIPGDIDPATRKDLAHQTAAALVERTRQQAHPEVVARLVNLVADHGMETVVGLWASTDADTLPGALYRLYALQQWTIGNGESASLWYQLGMQAAPVKSSAVGVTDPPTPEDLRVLVDEVLSGFYTGDLAGALERAGGYAQILATGIAFDADASAVTNATRGSEMTMTASNFARLGTDLVAAANLWRQGSLE